MKKIITTFTILALSVGFAQEVQESKGGKRTPPPAAIEICEGQDEGSSCTMETPRGDTVEGTCKNTPDGLYFACKPKHHKKERS
ncbi:MAG: Unknown protein [uncultured Sulfurovum sp.]|uniref:Uncharacterized protein n=1 Tax=uncultured Sulfurovum sp. TaxID=269237 RepID=A0A6S6SQD8_9BACT|nr:MAG: Unknown protein [uncultured Sulfurovum sp.]